MKKRMIKKSIITSALMLMVMVTLLVGTSLAWFNVTVVNEGNVITSGDLEVQFLMSDDLVFDGTDQDLAVDSTPAFVFDEFAQPGDQVTRYLKVTNLGTIDLAYEVAFSVTDGGLGEVVQIEVEGIDPVVAEQVYVGSTMTNESFGGSGLVQNDYEVYRITMEYDNTATLEGGYAGMTFEMNLILMAWQSDYVDSKPVSVSTLAELQTAALNAVKGQQIVVTNDINDNTATVAFTELINFNLGGNTITLQEFSVTSTDVGVMEFNNGTLNVDTYTINTPNAELTHGAQFILVATNSTINTSGNSYILNGKLSVNNLTLQGVTKLKPQDGSTMSVTGTIDAPEASIVPVVGAEIIVNSTSPVTAIDVTEADPVVQATVVSPGANDAIKTAIANAIAGDTLLIKAGVYNEGIITVDKDITIIGADKENTIIKPTTNTGSVDDARGWFLITIDVEFNLSTVTIDGEGFLIHTAIRSHGTGTIENIVMKNIFYTKYIGLGIYTKGQMVITNNVLSNIERVGYYVTGPLADGTQITNNYFYGKGLGDHLDYGVEVEGSSNIVISGNTIVDTVGVAASDGSTSAAILATTYFNYLYADNLTSVYITNNTFSNNTTGVYVGYTTTDYTYAEVNDNTFSENDYYLVNNSTDTGIVLADIMANNTFDINPIVNSDTGTYWIQPAVAYDEAELLYMLNSTTVETIYLGADINLTSELVITRSVTLDGNDFTLTATGVWGTTNSDKHMLDMGASDVTIKNVTLDSASIAYGIQAYVVTGIVLENVTALNSKGAGITVNGSTVTATDLNTSGNAWGAVNVDIGGGVTSDAVFTLISGVLSEDNQIWSDGANVTAEITVTVIVPDDYTEYTDPETGVTVWYN